MSVSEMRGRILTKLFQRPWQRVSLWLRLQWTKKYACVLSEQGMEHKQHHLNTEKGKGRERSATMADCQVTFQNWGQPSSGVQSLEKTQAFVFYRLFTQYVLKIIIATKMRRNCSSHTLIWECKMLLSLC